MKLKFVFISVLLGCLLSGQAVSDKDIKKVEALLDSSYAKTLIVDMKSSSLFAKQALIISKEKGYKQGEAWSNFYLAQGLFELLAYKPALIYLSYAEEVNKEVKDQYLTYEIHRVRSRVFGSMELLDSSIKEQKKGLEVVSQINKNENEKNYLRSLVYENLATTYSKLKNQPLFHYYLEKNKVLLEKQDPAFVYNNLISLYTMLGTYYTDEGQYKEAELFFDKAKQMAVQYKYPYISFTYRKWGDLEVRKKNPKSALEFYEKALAILNKTNFRREVPVVYKQMRPAYLLLNDAENAEKVRIKALELENELKTEQMKASSSAVEEILQQEKEKNLENNWKNYRWIVFIAAFLIIGIAIIFYRYYVKKQQLIKINEEALMDKEQKIDFLSNKINDSFNEVVRLAKSNSPEFFTRFQEIYPDIVQSLLKINPKLRVSELTLAAYIYLGFNTKDIAACTFRTLSTIRNRKHNLRTKLSISIEESTELWFKNLAKKN